MRDNFNEKMNKILLPFLVIFIAVLVSGCSSIQSKHYGNIPLESLKSAYVVLAPKGNPTIAGYINVALAQRNIKTRIGPIAEKPADAAFYVVYTDHWNWDVAVYLDSLDIQFIDNSNGQIIASGSFKNNKIVESWPSPRAKTLEVIDSIYNSK
jgi:hypothetical protein